MKNEKNKEDITRKTGMVQNLEAHNFLRKKISLFHKKRSYSPDSLTSSIGGLARLRFGAGMLVQSAAAGCCLRVLLSGGCALWSGHAGAAARCRGRVPLQGAARFQLACTTSSFLIYTPGDTTHRENICFRSL